MAKAMIRSMSVKAAKSDYRSQRLFCRVPRINGIRNRLGIKDLPDPLPHPDHVIIDPREGTARIVGPMTKAEKAEWDWRLERRETFQEECDWLSSELATSDVSELIPLYEMDLERCRRILNIIDGKLGADTARGRVKR